MRSRTILLACALGLIPTAVRAEVPADAIALFEQGLKDMEAGNTELACRELAASLAKYADSGTKGALAECYTRLGKVASAWKLWKDLADTAPVDLRPEAAENAAKLEARLPRYVVKLAAGTPTGLAVTIDGVAVADPTLPVPLPVDPGQFTVVASAPQHKPWTQSLQATEGKVTTIEIPALTAVPRPAPPPTVAPTPTPAQPAAPLRLIEGDNRSRRTRHIIGGTTMLAGVVAIGAGGYFGSVARSKWNDAKRICNGTVDPCPEPLADPAQEKIDQARSAAMISTVSIAAGGAAVLVGAIVWFTAPDAEHRIAIRPTIGVHSSGLALSGSF